MRMRHKKHGEERILACAEFSVPTPETDTFGRSIEADSPVIVPREIFGNDVSYEMRRFDFSRDMVAERKNTANIDRLILETSFIILRYRV